MKNCIDCGESKSLDNFYTDKTCKDGKVRRCIKCYEKIRLAKKKADPIAHLRKTQNFWLKHRYGITLEKYEEMYRQQDGKCAICNREDAGRNNSNVFCVDHCHETGVVRGLLCMPCNSALGQLKDDVNLLKKAINYLENKGINHEKKPTTNL